MIPTEWSLILIFRFYFFQKNVRNSLVNIPRESLLLCCFRMTALSVSEIFFNFPPWTSQVSLFSWMSTLSPILLGHTHINFCPFIIHFIFVTLLLSLRTNVLSLALILVYSKNIYPRFLKCKSTKQSDILIPWFQYDQHPRSLWIWFRSMGSGPVVSMSECMMTQFIIATMIMRTYIIHLVGVIYNIGYI